MLRLVLAAELAAIAVSSLFYAALFEDPMFWVAAALVALSAAAPMRQAKRHRHARERVDQVRGLEDPRDPEQQEPGRAPRRAAPSSARARARGATHSTTVSGSQIRIASQTNG